MGSDQPERPAGDDAPPRVDPDWWKDVLRPDGSARAGDPLTDPLPLQDAPIVAAAQPVDAPPVEAGPLPTAVPHEPPGLPEGGAPAAPDLLADPHAAPPPRGTAAPLGTAPPAVPQRLHVPRVEAQPGRTAPSSGSDQPPPARPAAQPAPPLADRPHRRGLGEHVGSRAADIGLLLLALAVVALVYLALTR